MKKYVEMYVWKEHNLKMKLMLFQDILYISEGIFLPFSYKMHWKNINDLENFGGKDSY